jgi:glyoxylase-like metal-dependent hydrolase (beta-lactamase superfamily II)
LRGYANGSVLVVPTRDGLLLVDGQSTKRVAEADSALRTVSRARVHWVVTTHYHGDHVEGNEHWHAAGAEIIGHENIAAQALKDTVITDFTQWHRVAAAPTALPSRTVGDSATLDLGGEHVVLLHVPAAHTDGDLLVWLPRRDLLHTGDIVEIGAFPFIDWWAGGTLDGMIAATDRIIRLAGERTAIVPGHGPTIDRRRVQQYRSMLVTARDRIGLAVHDGKTLDQVLADAPLASFVDAYGGERSAQRFTRLVYYGLTRPAEPGTQAAAKR